MLKFTLANIFNSPIYIYFTFIINEAIINMKLQQIFLILLISIFSLVNFSCKRNNKKVPPRVIITTDIQICCGDPDDVQSLCHLLWYGDELDIKAIIPDFFNREQREGIKAAEWVISEYKKDYENASCNFRNSGFPDPDHLMNDVLQKDQEEAIDFIITEAKKDNPAPLYILAWGNLKIIREALYKDPSIANKIRLLSIGTNVRSPGSGGDGLLPNWNGPFREDIFIDPRFDKLWWIENDWGYNAMFHGLNYGEEGRPIAGAPLEMLNYLSENAGALGKHIEEVVSYDRVKWAYYFRAGDTPTVLYLLDQENETDDPGHGSWAGKFLRPFPEKKPNYWTNTIKNVEWDYENPFNTWENAEEAVNESWSFALKEREEMYQELKKKIEFLYPQQD